MKKVLLIPTYHYLSNPLYIELKEVLGSDFRYIYFFTKDSTHIAGNLNNISEKKLSPFFDEYVEVGYEAPWVTLLKETRVDQSARSGFLQLMQRVKNLIGFKKYIAEVVRKIKKIGPDIIVCTSDMTLSYRIVKKYFPDIKVIILQPSFLDFRARSLPKVSIAKRCANYFLGGIFFPSQPYYGMENEEDKLLLFDERYLEAYQSKRRNVYPYINPYYYKLNQQVQALKTDILRERNAEAISVNKDKKTIILFLADYTSIYGDKVQSYFETAYIKLIKKYEKQYNFIVKNHPRIGAKDFEKNFIGVSDICFLNEELTYYEMLSLGDLNISINSVASLEAIACGMPTINFLPLDLHTRANVNSLSSFGGVCAYTYEALEELVDTFGKDTHLFYDNLEQSRLKLIGKNGECKEKLMNIFNSLLMAETSSGKE